MTRFRGVVGKSPVSVRVAEARMIVKSTSFQRVLQRLVRRGSPRQVVGALSYPFDELVSLESSFSHRRSSSTGRIAQFDSNRLRFSL
jgi:hypothetical protein